MSDERRCLAHRLAQEIGGGRVVAAFFSTYTFDREYFEKEPLAVIADNGFRRGMFPITVVVDYNRCRAGGCGYQVQPAPRDRLWHAKAILLLVRRGSAQRTILAVGSGNLTRYGWEENQEIFLLRVWEHWGVPRALEEWFLADWLKDTSFAKWCAREQLPSLNLDGESRLLSSLRAPLWQQLSLRKTTWTEAHVVAPFTDQRSDEEAAPISDPRTFLQTIVSRSRQGKERPELHVYLRGVRPKTAVGVESVFKRIEEDKRVRLWIHVVPPDQGGRLLHGKLYLWKGDYGRWTVVTGSPNATGPAMLSEQGNVELAWELKLPAHRPEWLLPEGEKLPVGKVKFVAPQFQLQKAWPAVENARCLMNRRVRLTWATGHGEATSRVFLGGKKQDPKQIHLRDTAERAIMVEPRSRRDAANWRPAWVPILMPAGKCDGAIEQAAGRSAEEWLSLFGAGASTLPCEGEETHRVLPKRRGKHSSERARTYDWHIKVMDLERRLAEFRRAVNAAEHPEEVDWLREIAEGVLASHNRNCLPAGERAWGEWVRVAVWHVLTDLPKDKLLAPLRKIGARRIGRQQLKEFRRG